MRAVRIVRAAAVCRVLIAARHVLKSAEWEMVPTVGGRCCGATDPPPASRRPATPLTETGGAQDLSYLNRDIRHIVIVDTNADSYANQPLNAVPIKPWQGDLDDTALLDLVPFLEAIFKEDIQDVRDVRPRADPVPPACYAWLELRGGSGRPRHRALRAQGSSGPATLRGGECPR